MSTPDIGSYYQQQRAEEIDTFHDVGLYQALRTGSVITLEMMGKYLGQVPASPFVVAELSKFSSDTLVKNLQKVVADYYANSISDPAIKAGIHALLLQTLAKIHQERLEVLQRELIVAEADEALLTKKTFVDTVAALQTVVDSVKKQSSAQLLRHVDGASSAYESGTEDLLDDFASYTAADGKRVDDLMDHLYQAGFSKFAPTEQDKTGLRRLRKLAAKDLHVGMAELQEQYQRMLRRLRKIEGFKQGTDDTVIVNLRVYVEKNPTHVRAKRVFEQLINIKRRLDSKQSLLTDTEFEVYLDQLCSADPNSGKIRRADLAKRTENLKSGRTRTVDQRYSLLRFEQNRFACTLGGTRKAPFQEGSRQKDHLFDDALVIGKGMFGTVKFAFDPVTGHAWADKKEVLGRTNTTVHDLDFKTKAVKLDETSAEQFALEGEILMRTELQVGRVVMERYQAKTSYDGQNPEFTLRHTLQRLLPGQDMKDMIDGEDKQRPASSTSAASSSPPRLGVSATPPRTAPRTISGVSTPSTTGRAAASATPPRSRVLVDPESKAFYQRQLEIRLGYAIQMTRGLYELHVGRGIIHGDVKPKNFMSRWFDFGTAGIIRELSTWMTEEQRLQALATARTGATFDLAKDGTPEYMAPNLCLDGRTTRGKVSLTPKDDIYSLGVSLFGITHFDTYQNITKARGRTLPETYYDGDDQLISSKPQRRVQIPDYAAAKVGDSRIYLGENEFESHGLRLGVLADQVVKHNPTDERFKTLAADLEQMFTSMCAIDPTLRADDRELKLHIMKLEELQAKVRALCSADQQRQQKLYAQFNALKDRSSKDAFSSVDLTILKQKFTEKHDRDSIEISTTEGTPLLNLLLDALQEEDAVALQKILSKIPPDDLLQMYQEAENGQHSPLVVAIVQCKPQLFGALLQHLPYGAMTELFTVPFNSSYHENENLLHIAAQLNQTQILQQIFTKFPEAAKTKIFSRPTNNEELDQYSVFEWAIYHQNKILIDLYCQQVGTRAELQTKIKEEKDGDANTLLHVALYQKATGPFKSLIEQSGITYQDLLTQEVYKNNSGLNPLFLAFDDNDIVVSELISLAQSNPDFAVIFNAFLFNKDNKMQLSPYHLAIRGNNPLIITALNKYVSEKPEIASQLQSLSDIKDKEDNNPLHDAIANRNVELVKFFLDRISTEKLSKLISDQNTSGVSVLQFLLLSGDPLYRVQDQEIFAAISHKASGLPVFKEILAITIKGESLPLYAAIKNQHPIIVQIIAVTLDPKSSSERDQYLAQLGRKDTEGRNALHHMANIEDGVLNDVIQGLYRHVGPDETVERGRLAKRLKELLTENDHSGKSALDYFAQNSSRDFTAILDSLKLHGILSDADSVPFTERLKSATATTDDSGGETSFGDDALSVVGGDDDSPNSTLNLAGPADLDSIESSPEADDIKNLRTQIRTLTAELETARGEIERTQTEADNLRITIAAQKSRISTLDGQLESLESERTDLSRRLLELESSSEILTVEKNGEIETISAALAEKNDEIVRLGLEKTAQQAELNALNRDLVSLGELVSAAETRASAAESKEKKANQELKELKLEHSEELKRQKDEFESNLSAARAEVDAANAIADDFRLQLDEKTASIAQLENKLKVEGARAQEISKTLEALKNTSAESQEAAAAKIAELNKELSKQQELVQTLTEDKSSKEASVVSLTLKLTALDSELEFYKERAMTAEAKVNELNTQLQAAKKEFDAELTALRAELETSVKDRSSKIAEFENTIAANTRILTEKLQTIQKLEEDAKRLNAEKEGYHTDLSKTISDLTREKATLEREVAELQSERDELKVQLTAAQVEYDRALADQSAAFAEERERLTNEVTAKQKELDIASSSHFTQIKVFETAMATLIQQSDAATSQVGIEKQGHEAVVVEVARLKSLLESSDVELKRLQTEHIEQIQQLEKLDAEKHSALLAQVAQEQRRALTAEAEVMQLQAVVGDQSSELGAARRTAEDAAARLSAVQKQHTDELARLEKDHASKIRLSDRKISSLEGEKKLLVEELLRARLKLEEAMGHIDRILPEEIDRLIAEYKQNVEASVRTKTERIGTLSESMVKLQVEIPARFATFKLEKSRLEATVERLQRELEANTRKTEEELAAKNAAIAAQEKLVTQALEANVAQRKEYQTAKVAMIAERDAAVRGANANAAFIAKKAEEFEQIVSFGHTALLEANKEKTKLFLEAYEQQTAILLASGLKLAAQQLKLADGRRSVAEERLAVVTGQKDHLEKDAVGLGAQIAALRESAVAQEAKDVETTVALAAANDLAEVQRQELAALRESSVEQLREQDAEHKRVIAALENQITGLTSQGKGKDGEVAELRQRIKDLEAAHAAELAEIESGNAAAETALRASFAEQQARGEGLALANAAHTATISDLQQSLEQKNARIDELERENETLRGKITDYEARESAIRVELDAAKKLVAKREAELEQMQQGFTAQLETIRTSHASVIRDLESEVSRLEAQGEGKATALEKRIEELQEKHKAALEQMQLAHAAAVTELEKTVATQTRRIGELERTTDSISAEKTAAEERITQLQSLLAVRGRINSRTRARVQELRQSLQTKDAQIAELTAQRDAITHDRDQGAIARVRIEEELARERESREFGDQIIGWHVSMIEEKDQMIVQLQAEIARLRAELGSKDTREAEQEAALSAAEEERARLAALLADSDEEKQRLARELAALKVESKVDQDTSHGDSPVPEAVSPSPAIATPPPPTTPAAASASWGGRMVRAVVGYARSALSQSPSPEASAVTPDILADLEVEVDLDPPAPGHDIDPASATVGPASPAAPSVEPAFTRPLSTAAVGTPVGTADTLGTPRGGTDRHVTFAGADAPPVLVSPRLAVAPTAAVPEPAVIPVAAHAVFTSAHVKQDPYFASVMPETKILKVTAPEIKVDADTSDLEKHRRKTALALEVFLMTYLAGSGKGHPPVLRVKGADPELVALYCAFVELFAGAGLESTFTKPDFISEDAIRVAKTRIEECFDISAAASMAGAGLDKSVVDLIISLYLNGGESSQAQYKGYVSDKMGWAGTEPGWGENNALFSGRHIDSISTPELQPVFSETMITIASTEVTPDHDDADYTVLQKAIMQVNGIDPATLSSRNTTPRR